MEMIQNRVLVETRYQGANVSCIPTAKGLVLVDTPLWPRDGRAWKKRITDATNQEVAYMINTDHHFDHVLTNSILADQVICHTAAARGIHFIQNKAELKKIIEATFPGSLRENEEEIDDLKIDTPSITFDHKLTLNMEDATLNLEFVGGHSPGTILIHLVEGGVVFSGDNVEGNFPYFGQCQFFPWKETLRRILSIEFEFIVPGHGPVGGREMVQRYLDFFQELEEEVRDFCQKGLSPEEMVQRSRAIRFFPHEEGEGLTWGWREEQYRTVAGKILKELCKRKQSGLT